MTLKCSYVAVIYLPMFVNNSNIYHFVETFYPRFGRSLYNFAKLISGITGSFETPLLVVQVTESLKPNTCARPFTVSSNAVLDWIAFNLA